jgi:hypothetical protein
MDQAGGLGQRNELAGQDQAALGWFQRTSASKPITCRSSGRTLGW